jgi:hypothetical protein
MARGPIANRFYVGSIPIRASILSGSQHLSLLGRVLVGTLFDSKNKWGQVDAPKF